MSDYDVPVSQMPNVRFDQSSTHAHVEPQMVALRATLPLGATKIVGMIPVSTEVLADTKMMRAAMDLAFDRTFRPWRYPDRSPFPVFDLFPRWTEWEKRWAHWKQWWQRRHEEWPEDD